MEVVVVTSDGVLVLRSAGGADGTLRIASRMWMMTTGVGDNKQFKT